MTPAKPVDDSGRELAELLWISSSARMVRQEVVERLREAIRLGQFTPGQRLLERELCEWTGVSRTSIREALRQLESEGLVEIIPRRGPAVSVISAAAVRDIYEVRKSVEPRMVELFVERAADETVENLLGAAETLAKAAAAADPVEVVAAKARYFDVLVAGCENPTLGEVVGSLHVKLTLVKSAYLQRPERWTESARELGAIADAIGMRDARRAAKLCRKHLVSAAKAALAAVEAGEQAPSRKRAV